MTFYARYMPVPVNIAFGLKLMGLVGKLDKDFFSF